MVDKMSYDYADAGDSSGGITSKIKKYWWVGALGVVGYLVLHRKKGRR